MFIIDVTIAILMLLTIIYLWRLNRKIDSLRSYKQEFIELIKVFDDSILKADSCLEEMKKIGGKSLNDVKQRFEQAKYIADDLAFLTDRASDLADKIEVRIREAKKAEESLQNTRPRFEELSRDAIYKEPPKTNFVQKQQPPQQEAEKPLSNSTEKKRAIQSLLEKISSNKDKTDNSAIKKIAVRHQYDEVL
jgi:SMC interacting uncharacterized protein involved in chromosome segregation